MFAALLDTAKGGISGSRPATDDTSCEQMYFPDTAILITRFMAEDGVAEVMDFMPIEEPERATDRHRLVGSCALCGVAMRFAASSARRGSTTGAQATNWR